jgi:spore coat polysaccharide biosynthesis protein SpsF
VCSSDLDEILVATTREKTDDRIAQRCTEWGVQVFRGSTDDVLARYYDAFQWFLKNRGPVTSIVRITADCPFLDPGIVDNVINDMTVGQYDYVSNVDPPTYPDGLDVEVFSPEALEEAYTSATLASDREHVTPYIRNNPRFRKHNHRHPTDLSSIRLTLDTGKDFLLISRIYEALYQPEKIFVLDDIMRLLHEQPSLLDINSGQTRNEGYRKSLQHDQRV